MPQATVQNTVSISGIGVHTGAPVSLVVKPADIGAGIVFVRTDVLGPDNCVPVTPTAVTSATLSTVITNRAGVSVATIEHIMSALAALGITNAVIELDGPEVPIMDGSARDFVALLDQAGVQPQNAPSSVIKILEPITITDGDKHATLLPSDDYVMDCQIDFATPLIGQQRIVLNITEQTFRQDIANARTFGFAEDVEKLRAQGLARGGSLDNCIVIKNDSVQNPGGLRFADEFVRHKVLDAIGDFYVLGMPLQGKYVATKPGHAVNNLMVRAMLDAPQSWQVVEEAQTIHAAQS